MANIRARKGGLLASVSAHALLCGTGMSHLLAGAAVAIGEGAKGCQKFFVHAPNPLLSERNCFLPLIQRLLPVLWYPCLITCKVLL